MPLSVRKVKTAGPGRYTDGSGLMLVVKPSGTRSWVLRYQIDGRRRDMGLGSFPEVTLAMARDRSLQARREIAEGRDPLSQKAKSHRLQFGEAARELIAAKRESWRNAKHAAQWTSTLERHVLPSLGDRDVRSIETNDVLAVLNPIWTEKPETASRVRQRIEAVLDYSRATGKREGANPARWRGHLDQVLAQPNKVRTVAHFLAMDWREVPGFMSALGECSGLGAQALAFAILTSARSGEVRGATWSEFDLEQRVWTIPPARMKAAKEHRVPLSAAAMEQLPEPGDPEALVFPSVKDPRRPISDMTLSAVLKRLGRKDVTVHGFRSSFRDWAGETTQFPREVIEAALAHRLKDKAEAAYARGDLFQKRRALMLAWASYLDMNGDQPVENFR